MRNILQLIFILFASTSGQCNGLKNPAASASKVTAIGIYSDEAPTVQFTSSSTIINEGEASVASPESNSCMRYIDKIITIKISKVPLFPVTISINPPSGTATEGVMADFSIIPTNVILEEGYLSKDVVVRVYNDAYIEENETLTLTYSISNPIGGDAVPNSVNQKHLVTIIDDDFTPSVNGSMDIISANFNSHSIPADWKVVGGGSYPQTWAVMDFGSAFALDPAGHPFLQIDGYQSGGNLDKVVETSTFNSIGMTSINLSYLEIFGVHSGDLDARAQVDVWDGSTWQNILTENNGTGNIGAWNNAFHRSIAIPLTYTNLAMKLRFRYTVAAKYLENLWIIDNMKISGTYNANIQSEVSLNPDQQYIGPNATVHFYDPITGNLIAKIKNLSAHDYGCTTVQVDRAGIDEMTWWGQYKITKKTFNVIPTNNNPNGSYEITLYYKNSELVNFNGTNIKSMGKSEGGIMTATYTNSTSSPVEMTPFNSDFAYTATFSNGFSGFGLTDAPGGSLPVILSKFEGKHSKDGNVLMWETTEEVNNEHFIVERSRDARKFKEISKIDGVGTSVTQNRYTFTDLYFDPGINYYRLKQVDKDGKSAYTRTISLTSSDIDFVRLFPNPVQSILNIELPKTEAYFPNVCVSNSSGESVFNYRITKLNKDKILLDMSKLPTGIYKVTILGQADIRTFSILKVH